jgi:hypothetical protein
MEHNVVKAEKAEWLAPPSTKPVLVFQNPNLRSGINESWICDHAAPQASTEEGQIIVCEACLEALDAGARIVKEQ